jgi:hypothetical protein
MSHKFLLNTSFHKRLVALDQELAEQTRLAGCQCGGNLYQSNYPRSPFGMPFALREHYQERLSFCCGLCRKRTTSPSVRFFGRRWFPEPLLIFISALKLGATESRCVQIKRLFGVTISQSTWKRWRRWWCTSFTESHFWIQAKGFIPIEHLNGPFPRKLLSVFIGCLEERLVFCLKFLAPVTAGIARAV